MEWKHRLSDKEKVPGPAVSKEGHIDSVLVYERTHHYWFPCNCKLGFLCQFLNQNSPCLLNDPCIIHCCIWTCRESDICLLGVVPWCACIYKNAVASKLPSADAEKPMECWLKARVWSAWAESTKRERDRERERGLMFGGLKPLITLVLRHHWWCNLAHSWHVSIKKTNLHFGFYCSHNVLGVFVIKNYYYTLIYSDYCPHIYCCSQNFFSCCNLQPSLGICSS